MSEEPQSDEPQSDEPMSEALVAAACHVVRVVVPVRVDAVQRQFLRGTVPNIVTEPAELTIQGP